MRSTVPTMRPPVLIADFVNAPGHAERHIGVGQIGWAAGGRLVGAQSAVPLRDGGNDRSQSPVHRWGRECGRRRAGPKRSKTRSRFAPGTGSDVDGLKAKHIHPLRRSGPSEWRRVEASARRRLLLEEPVKVVRCSIPGSRSSTWLSQMWR